MAHTYANLDQFKKFLTDGGTAYGTTNDDMLLTILEGSSRRVDRFCDRSRFGSGFGPRIGTNRYDAPDSDTLEFNDDLLSVATATYSQTTGSTPITLTADTDFYLYPDTVPYRRAELTWIGTGSFGAGKRGVSYNGTWGYQNVTTAVGTLALASGSALTGVLSGGTAYPGMTIFTGSEHVYVTAASSGTLTLLRGQNGTTAAAGTAVAAYFVYPADVVTGTLMVGQRRVRMRDAGAIGDFGGGGLPTSGYRDTENSLLRSTVGHLRPNGGVNVG